MLRGKRTTILDSKTAYADSTAVQITDGFKLISSKTIIY